MSLETPVFNPDRPRIHSVRLHEDEAVKLAVDFNYWAAREGGALSSAVWTVKAGNITIGSDTEAGNVSTALVTVTNTGNALIEVKGTLDSAGGSQIGVQFIEILTPVVDKLTKRYW